MSTLKILLHHWTQPGVLARAVGLLLAAGAVAGLHGWLA
jgi:hypothetical protein